ncbi:hypothetical protein ACWD95_30470, partial [Streptomyces sp. NPDC005069]
ERLVCGFWLPGDGDDRGDCDGDFPSDAPGAPAAGQRPLTNRWPVPHRINSNHTWAPTSGRHPASKEGPAATAEPAGKGSLDDQLAV